MDVELVARAAPARGDVEIFRCRGELNWTGFCSAKVNPLRKASNAEFDPTRRISDLAKADRIVARLDCREAGPAPARSSAFKRIRKADGDDDAVYQPLADFRCRVSAASSAA
jgi:hypothetical protein